MIELFIKSVLIGLCAAIPMGPIAILCIQKTMSAGRRAGFAVGFGSSFGDTTYAAISFLSIAYISKFLDDNRAWVLVVGGILILVIGLAIACTNPVSEIKQKRRGKAKDGLVRNFLQSLFMTFTNPGALVLMLGLVAFFKLDLGTNSIQAPSVWLAIAGVFVGTNAWWFGFTSLLNIFRKRVKLKQLITINRISGIAIAVLGAISLFQGIFQLMEI